MFVLMKKANRLELLKLRSIGNYQFGKGAGRVLFSNRVALVHSRETGKIRLIYLNDKLLATLRPRDGQLALALEGAKLLLSKRKSLPAYVTVRNDVGVFIKTGRNVFARHVSHVDEALRPEDEVIVLDEDRNLLAVGRAALSGEEMKAFKFGVAVRVRRGVEQKRKSAVEPSSSNRVLDD
jgi:predicted RNA-binding protein (TIGR00451 family)